MGAREADVHELILKGLSILMGQDRGETFDFGAVLIEQGLWWNLDSSMNWVTLGKLPKLFLYKRPPCKLGIIRALTLADSEG